MSEMVERVALAITQTFEREARVFDAGQAEMLARAAIEAMREPSAELLSKFEDLLDTQCAFQTMEAGWAMMIDEALK